MKRNSPHGTAPQRLSFREAPRDSRDFQTRTLALSARAPSTIDEGTRSVEVVAATQNPVLVFDYSRYEQIQEVLLMSGLQGPPAQVPLLDTHNRWSTQSLLGSARGFHVEGEQLICRVHYTTAPEGESAWLKTKEGHLTDNSVGYQVHAATYVEDGQTATIEGKQYTGPIKVVTQWAVKELSVCPIGADEDAVARASAGNPQPQEETPVNKRFKAYLVSRGLSPDATDEQARQFAVDNTIAEAEIPAEFRAEPEGQAGAQPPEPDTGSRSQQPPPSPQPAPVDPPVDPQRAADDAVAAERARCAGIRSMCGRFQADHLVDGLISDGTSLQRAQERVMDFVANRMADSQGPGFAPNVRITTDARDRFRAVAQDGLALRVGLRVEQPAAGFEPFQGYTLRELARECLRQANQPMPHNPLEMVGRALTTSDLPILLGNIAHLSLLEGWEDNEETWDQWCATGSVTDFKIHTGARPGALEGLEEIPEEGEYKYGKMDEAKEQYKIATYGKAFRITRQAIINDELDVLSTIPREHGRLASEKIGDIAYAVIVANAAMGDGTALFDSDHSNLMSGAAPSAASLGAAEVAMRKQKDFSENRRLRISPETFLAPVALLPEAEEFFGSKFIGTQAQPNVKNRYYDAFNRIYEPRLDDDSLVAWYLLGPKGKVVKVFFLNGNQTPFLDTEQDWNTDGVKYKVRVDAGAKAMDWVGAVKNPGEGQ